MNGAIVSPSVDGAGEVVDFEVKSGGPGGYTTSADEYVEDVHGNLHHHFEDVQLQEDEEGSFYNQESHNRLIDEAMPGLGDAIVWANDIGLISPQEIEALDAAIKADNHEDLIPKLENIYQSFVEAGGLQQRPAQTQHNRTNPAGQEPRDLNQLAAEALRDDDDEVDVELESFVDDLYESFPDGRDGYREMMVWAYHNLPSKTIDTYDNLMDSGSYQEIQKAVEHLYRIYKTRRYQTTQTKRNWNF